MSSTLTALPASPSRKALTAGLWVAQALLGLAFCAIGVMKLTSPIAQLAQFMPWAGQFPPGFVRVIGIIDILGGLGVVLPALTGVLPRLTVLAALGCTVLQVLAIGFHVSRGEFQVLPLNFILLPLAAFILWGRGWKLR